VISVVCGLIYPPSLYFFLGKHTVLSSRFPVQKSLSRPDFINKVMDACYVWNFVPRKFMTKFSWMLSIGITFHI
jgi:hypothetical protein